MTHAPTPQLVCRVVDGVLCYEVTSLTIADGRIAEIYMVRNSMLPNPALSNQLPAQAPACGVCPRCAAGRAAAVLLP
jgi:hypothetical protein